MDAQMKRYIVPGSAGMYKGYKILAVVTARGGSKGLPGKNIKELNGMPLIGWTLEQTGHSRYLDEVFVSTDSEEIAGVSERLGYRVPSLRPARLAQDGTSSMDVLEYTISFLEKEGKRFDYVMLLEPTSPLRKKEDIDNIIALAAEHPEKDGVISVGEVHGEHPSIVKKISPEGLVAPYIEDGPSVYQRQQCDRAYFPYGVGYLIRIPRLMEAHTIYTDRMLPYYIERWQNYEIDDIYDFVCIESIMKMERERL